MMFNVCEDGDIKNMSKVFISFLRNLNITQLNKSFYL